VAKPTAFGHELHELTRKTTQFVSICVIRDQVFYRFAYPESKARETNNHLESTEYTDYIDFAFSSVKFAYSVDKFLKDL